MVARVGLIGTGILGSAIAERLARSGVVVKVYNRTIIKAKKLQQVGVKVLNSPVEVAEESDLIFLCVSGEAAAREILFSGDCSIVKRQQKHMLSIVDLSTIDPILSIELFKTLKKYNIEYLDCPVSGGREGALSGALTAICSGSKDVFDLSKEVIRKFSKDIFYVGKNGNAQIFKILNNLAEGINLLCASEVINLGIKLGCSLEDLRSVLSSARGNSAYMNLLFRKLIESDGSVDVSLGTRVKDLSLARKLFDSANNKISPISGMAINLFNDMMKLHGGDEDQTKCFGYINAVSF